MENKIGSTPEEPIKIEPALNSSPSEAAIPSDPTPENPLKIDPLPEKAMDMNPFSEDPIKVNPEPMKPTVSGTTPPPTPDVVTDLRSMINSNSPVAETKTPEMGEIKLNSMPGLSASSGTTPGSASTSKFESAFNTETENKPEMKPEPKKSGTALFVFLTIVLVLLSAGVSGFFVYSWQSSMIQPLQKDKALLQSQAGNLKSQVDVLQKELESQKAINSLPKEMAPQPTDAPSTAPADATGASSESQTGGLITGNSDTTAAPKTPDSQNPPSGSGTSMPVETGAGATGTSGTN